MVDDVRLGVLGREDGKLTWPFVLRKSAYETGRKSLDELSRYGAERAKEMGLDKLSEDEQIDYVNRTIKESRKEDRNR